MRTIAILLSLTMIACSFAGCLGGDDDESELELIGDWYYGDVMAIEFKGDGTAVTSEENGTWAVGDDSLTVNLDDQIVFTYAVFGDWLWLMEVGEDDGCTTFAPDAVPEGEWEDTVNEQTPPPMCEGLTINGNGE